MTAEFLLPDRFGVGLRDRPEPQVVGGEGRVGRAEMQPEVPRIGDLKALDRNPEIREVAFRRIALLLAGVFEILGRQPIAVLERNAMAQGWGMAQVEVLARARHKPQDAARAVGAGMQL